MYIDSIGILNIKWKYVIGWSINQAWKMAKHFENNNQGDETMESANISKNIKVSSYTKP